MSAVTAGLDAARSPAASRRIDGLRLALLVACPLALLMSWSRLQDVWQTGTFFDTDDAMRMVQVRDWLAGQGWFDLVAHRMDPPIGVPMHWLRVVDVPIAALLRLFGPFADPVHAERLARIAFPLALQAGMIAATGWVARILAGPRAVLPASILVLLSGIAYVQFQPGRIDHHAPQILLLMLATGTTALALDAAHGRWAALTGLLVSVSLAISLENLPFFAVLLAMPPLAWVVGGRPHRAGLIALALGLGVSAPALFLATVAPANYGAGACDAYSMAHLGALLAGVTGLGLLALLSPRLTHPLNRAAAAGVVGAAVLVLLHTAYPACLHSPYAAMDPLIERLWLSNVTEAQPMMTAIRQRPDTLTMVVCPILAGLLAALSAVWRSTGLTRARWAMLSGLVVIGLLGLVWEVRVATSVSPLAVLPGAWLVGSATAYAVRRGRPLLVLLPLLLLLPFSAIAWALVPMRELSPDIQAQLAGGVACRRAAAVEPLASLPPQTVFAPIDAGSHLLAHTGLSVVGAPYHRNQHGDALVLRGFVAGPEEARAIVKASGADLLAFCPTDTQLQILAKEAPAGLAKALLDGRIPDWLSPVAAPGTAYRVFRVR